MRAFLCLVILLTSTAAGSALAQAADDEWLVLIYLDGDNDLEAAAVKDFDEIAANLPQTATIFVLADLAESSDPDTGHTAVEPDWHDSRIVRLQGDEITLMEELGEVDMTDPQTLAYFVGNYLGAVPGARTSVILWDHGGGWPGMFTDDSHPDSPMMTVAGMAAALEAGTQHAGVPRIDLLGLDACLMATLEVAEAVAPYARYMVASEELEPGDGWDYASFMADLDAKLEPRELASEIVRDYVAWYAPIDPATTQSALDLDELAPFLASVETMAQALVALPDAELFEAAQLTNGVTRFEVSGVDGKHAADLGQIVDGFTRSSNADLAAAAQTADALLSSLVVEEGHNSGFANLGGITIFAPQAGVDSSPAVDSYQSMPPYAEELGRLQLSYIARLAMMDATEPTIDSFALSNDVVALVSPVVITGTIQDDHIADIAFVLMSEEDGNTFIEQVLRAPAPVDVDGNPRAYETVEDVEYTWDGSVLALESGEDLWIVPFAPREPGSPIYEVYGYLGRGEREIDVVLRFDERTGAFVNAYDLVRDRELALLPGDTFAWEWTGFDADGEDVTATSDMIDVPASGFRMTYASAPDADYLLALVVDDLAGNFAVSDLLPVRVQDDPGEDLPPVTPTPATPTPATPTPATPSEAVATPTGTGTEGGPTDGADTPLGPVALVGALVAALFVTRRGRRGE